MRPIVLFVSGLVLFLHSPDLPAQGDWHTYETVMDKSQVMVQVNMDYRNQLSGEMNLVKLVCHLPDLQDAQMSTLELFDTYDFVLDSLLHTKASGSLAGVIYTSNQREVYYYLDQPEIMDEVLIAYQRLLPRAPVYGMSLTPDPTWAAYHFVLLPPPLDLLAYDTERQAEDLRSQGDDPLKERPISHKVLFFKEKDRDKFIDKVQELGYIPSEKETLQHCELCYAITATKSGITDLGSLKGHIQEVYLLASKFKGEYSHWWCNMVLD